MGPPTDDPREHLYAAARRMTMVGWTYASFGVLFIIFGVRARQVALAGVCFLAGGVFFLIAGAFARRHHRWAVWLGIATAILIGVALALLLMLLGALVGWHDLVSARSIASSVALLLLAFIFVHGMIVWNLSNAFDAAPGPQGPAAGAGFEPVAAAAPRPVIPLASDDGPTAAR